MPNWEYKVITSGKGGFASPAMLEKFLNDLGKEEWEVIEFRTAPDNALAFNGLARRSTQRDWTLEDAAATAAKAEADKVRAEFEAKFKGLSSTGESAASEDPTKAVDDGYRSPVDTSRDQDPDTDDEETDEWEKLAEEEELPTFFDAIKPHMRRNQRGAGQSVGVDYLAKKWGFDEADITGALKECGFVVPDDENAAPQYLEYDGDLYWVNINRRGEVWINTKEKPQPKFRVVAGQPVTVEEPEKQNGKNGGAKEEPKKAATEKSETKPAATPEPVSIPEGEALLEFIRPKMRRNRGDAGGSGSASFLSRAFKWKEPDLLAAFATLKLELPENGKEKPAPVEIGEELWWLNKDQRGGVWINVKPKVEPKAETKSTETEPKKTTEPAPAESTAGDTDSLLLRLRPSLKATRTGAVAAETSKLAESLEKSADDLVSELVAAGLKVPEKAREKPVFVELNGEIYWLNKNAKGQLWLNAKASKFKDDESGEQKPKRPRSRKSAAKPAAEEAPKSEE